MISAVRKFRLLYKRPCGWATAYLTTLYLPQAYLFLHVARVSLKIMFQSHIAHLLGGSDQELQKFFTQHSLFPIRNLNSSQPKHNLRSFIVDLDQQ